MNIFGYRAFKCLFDIFFFSQMSPNIYDKLIWSLIYWDLVKGVTFQMHFGNIDSKTTTKTS